MKTLEAAESWVDARRQRGEIGRKSAENYLYRLGLLAAVVPNLADLDRAGFDRWQRSVGERTPASRRAYLSTVHRFCLWLVAEGHIPVDPSAHAARVREPRRVPRALSAAAVRQLFAAATDSRDRAAISLMVEMGLRCCEVANLQLDDWDRSAATMFVRGKNDSDRVLPVPAPVALALKVHLNEQGWSAGPLLRHRGRGMAANGWSRHMTALFRAAGLKNGPYDGRSAHALRHTAASDVLDRCKNVRTVQAMLGHASIATTQIYLRRANLDQLREAMSGRDYVLSDSAA